MPTRSPLRVSRSLLSQSRAANQRSGRRPKRRTTGRQIVDSDRFSGCATALEQVSYVMPSFDDCLAALNRAARLIDGDPEPANVVPLKRKAAST
jgi:hypothetical protein